MEDFSLRRRIFGSLALAAMFVLIQTSPRAQETAGGAGKIASPEKPAVQSPATGDDLSLSRLIRQLTRYRKAGNAESAARIFAELFPSEPAGDPVYGLKTSASLPADSLVGAAGGGKIVVAAEGAHPVFATPEHEMNPSADVRVSPGGVGTYYSAAEQWTGDRPGYIRVRKSTDSGSTWPQSLVVGDGRPVTHPFLRVVADDTIGVAYVKEWDPADGDIYFARLDAAMTSAAEIPVALSLSGQSAPSIATDREAYASPYVYLVYAERDGSAGSVKFRVSQDLGGSWSRGKTIASFPWPAGSDVETALAFDPDESALHLAYTVSEGGSTEIAVATSRDFGASWSMFTHLTTASDGTAHRPAIAARGGTVIVAYERETPEKGADVGMAYSLDSGRSWTVGHDLAATAAAERSPDVRSLAGPAPASFFASYVEANDRIVVMRAKGSAPGSWTTELTYPDSGISSAMGSAIILPLPSGAGEGSAGILWTDTSADDDIFFSASAHILAPGPITLTPPDALISSGLTGGPFTPSSLTYTLTNTGDEAITYHCTKTQAWTTVDPAAVGTLAAATSIPVTVSINSAANSALPGNYNDTVTFANLTNGTGNTTRQVTLNISPKPGSLAVTPAVDWAATGVIGGPFTPPNQTYMLQNTGEASLDWTCAKVQTWTTLSGASGTLGAGASTSVTVSINTGANGLAAGTYTDVATFTNTTNGTGNTTRSLTLTVTNPGVLAVTPATGLTSTGPVGGPFTPSSQAYTLQNTGGTSINWTATNVQTWTSLSAASGTLAAGATTTVTVSINAGANSLLSGTYTDVVSFSNTTNGTGNTNRAVALTVAAAGVLAVTPATDLTSTGPVGGPFTPSSQAYTLQNTGATSLNWTAAKTQAWTTLSAASGTLAAGATTTVTVTINATANGLAAGTYNDTVTFTNTTNGVGNATRAVALTVTTPGVLTVTPATGLTSTGPVGGPFTPSSQTYTLQNTGGTSINWTAAKTQTWTSIYIVSGTLAPGASVTLDILINNLANGLAAGSYTDALTITNTTNGTGNTTRSVTLTVTNPGVLAVTPATGLTSSGTVGGPFTPTSQAYTLQNTGGTSINWTASNGQTWTTLSAASGTLAAGATTTVTVSINSGANALAAGTYNDTIIIANATNGSGSTTRPVALTVGTPGALAITPAGNLVSSGTIGGPFAPSNQAYTLQNTGGQSINWTAAKTQAWTTLSATSGTLAAGATATVTVSINTAANSLAAGTYNDTVTITNTTNGTGNGTRGVTLTVNAPGVLTVTPAAGLTSAGPVGGPFTPSSQTYTLQNTGGTSINWTAAKTQTWTSIYVVSGTLAPGASVTVDILINNLANGLAAGTYTDTLTITNTTNGTGNTSRGVSLTVTAPGAMTVTPATGLTSSGTVGGPFTPTSQAYTIQNTGGTSLNWTATNGQTWTTLSAASGTLAAGASTSLTVTINSGANALAAGTYNDTVIIANTTNGSGSTTRPVTLTVGTPGALTVTPGGDLISSGTAGGPFAPSNQAYTLQNTGGQSINWTCTKLRTWTTLSAASGTLAAGATVTVTVSINSGANSLAAGTYNDTVTFTNTTNGTGNATRGVTLTVTAPGVLAVTPAAGLTSTGTVGGPFTPSSQTYTLQNTGGTAINWTASKTQTWTSLFVTSGSLAPGGSVTLDILINNLANSLTPGTYTDTLTITNTTNGTGSTTRGVTLTVAAAGVLAVTPATGLTSSGLTGGPFTPSSQAYTLQNTGGTAINWACSNGQTWTSLSATSGTLAAGASTTVTVSINSAANTLAAGTFNDTIIFSNTTNGTGNTTRAVALTVSAPGVLSVIPATGLTSSGLTGGPFTPSSQAYTLQNTGGSSINWTAAKTRTWTTLSAASGTLAAGATATVTVTINSGANSLAAGTYNDTVTFTNTTNGTGNATRAVALTIYAPGDLAVTPTGGLTSTGPAGGPFTPSTQTYTLRNTGGSNIDWTASKTQNWTSLYVVSGTLAPGASVTVDILINNMANSLAAGTYNDTLTITNTTNGSGNTTRPVALTVTEPGVLAVTPAGGLTSAGLRGGPFSPSSQVYTLQNTGGTAINWTSTKAQAWTTLSAASGTLNPGATATVTVTINSAADSLAAGVYNDSVTFTNATNALGNTARAVTLTVNPGPDLAVDPASRDVPFVAGTTTFDVSNAGGGTLNWTATVIAGGDWLSIVSGSSGTGAGTITAAYAESQVTSTRVGTIRISAPGAEHSPRDVTVTQTTSALLLSLTAQRLVEKAWIIQREYGRLSVTVSNPGSVEITSYLISRSAAGGNPTTAGEVAASTVSSPWVYNDTFLENGTTYTYRILALDAQGNVIGASNAITI
jgi:hypothetical protein